MKDELEVEIEVADDLLKHARKLALTRDPRRRIVISRWEIFFAEKLAEFQRQQAAIAKQLPLLNVVPEEEHEQAVNFSKQRTEGAE